jgi:hypothetical protein
MLIVVAGLPIIALVLYFMLRKNRSTGIFDKFLVLVVMLVAAFVLIADLVSRR